MINGLSDDNVHFQHTAEMARALINADKSFETMYYPNKNHGISGSADNTSYHLWNKMTNWLYENLRDDKTPVGGTPKEGTKNF